MKILTIILLLWAVPVMGGDDISFEIVWDEEKPWGELCDKAYERYLEAEAYGAWDFNCSEYDGTAVSDYSMANEDSQTMERDKIFQGKYEKRIAELEERMLGLRKAIACVTDISIYPEPGYYLAKDEELDCFVWKEDLSDITVEPTSSGMNPRLRGLYP